MGNRRLDRKPLRSRGRSSIPVQLTNFGCHEVFSEGIKTEPLYIENIKSRIASKYSCQSNVININCHNKDGVHNTLSLVEYAENEINKMLKDKKHVDHVWIFFDKDDFPSKNFDNAYFKIINKNDSGKTNDDGDKCDENGICWHACWSNECFELWPILHFEYLTAALSREDYINKINTYIKNETYGKYTKNSKNIYDLLEINGGDFEKAIKFAKKLNCNNLRSNPSTGVYEFLEFFKNYLKSSKN